MKRVVWGIIGCGDVAEKKSGPAFNIVNNSSLLAVMRRDIGKAKDFANRHNVPFYFDDANDIINHPEINSIYIATPPSTHLQYALAVLKVNKNVYLEKPMTLNVEEAKDLHKALEKSSSKLTVAHYRRGLPMFLKVKDLINEEALGTTKSIELNLFQSRHKAISEVPKSNWRLNPAISGGGYFHDLAPHQLDLLLFWFGNIKDYSGDSVCENPNRNFATKINGIINFERGLSCKASWDFLAAESEQKDECIISGTKGSLTFALFGDKITIEKDGKEEILKFEHPKYIQTPMIQNTTNYFLGKNENPCSVEDGLVTMKIIDDFTS
ncbi:Gfo/Idh/MocA family protein [Winogradskyella sp. R77965]|uniref:Gfo/Idh/MocA family protein n=1 Tax=Winogradskyella sp. R77965 TaxID=3093872 RepID=UPI0037DC8C9B